MNHDESKGKVKPFFLSEETAKMIRRDVEQALKEGEIDASYAEASKQMPLLLTIPLTKNRALIGLEEKRDTDDDFSLDYEPPRVKLEPVSLISSSIFVGRGSCHIGWNIGGFSVWHITSDC